MRHVLQGLGYFSFSVIENYYINALFSFKAEKAEKIVFTIHSFGWGWEWGGKCIMVKNVFQSIWGT